MRKRIGILILTFTLSLLLLNSFAHGQLSNGLRVSFIDVGQGDSAWLRASDNTDILIDGGPRSAGPTVVAHLQQEGIDDIDVMVLSHGDADHVGGLIDVLKSTIHVEAVIYNGHHHTTDTYSEFLTEMQKRGLTPTPAQIGQTHSWGAVSASVLNPQEVPTGDQNDDSVIMLVTYGDVEFLFTGDVDSTVEQTILDTGTPVAAEVLKVAHHGSKYSSSTTFLQAVGPDVAVISVGANSYGHPAEETLDRLRAVGARIFRTDLSGAIVVNTDGETYEVEADFLVFLPMVARNFPATPTPTPSPTSTPTPTASPSPTWTPTATSTSTPTATPTGEPASDVMIGDIREDTADEYIEIRNQGTASQDMTNWQIQSYANRDGYCEPTDQWYTFPSGYVLQAGASVWVHSGPDAVENPPSHLRWTGSYIWHNDGDVGVLYDSVGGEVDRLGYGECE